RPCRAWSIPSWSSPACTWRWASSFPGCCCGTSARWNATTRAPAREPMPEAGAPAMLWVIILFLGLSLLLYCLLAGADFGAGALELFLRGDGRHGRRRIIDRALGPVWEANHIWLIL